MSGRNQNTGPVVPDETFRRIAADNDWSPRATARALGLSYSSGISQRIRRLRDSCLSVDRPPSSDVPIAELLDARERRAERRRKAEESGKLIRIRLPERGPFGLMVFGDPHLDDDGTDIGLLRRHTEMVKRSSGVYACTVGDITNNWVGRLARLYADQGTTAREAWQLAQWWLEELRGRWAFIVGGNHDAWSGAGDPLDWISGQVDALYQSAEVRAALTLPGGRQFIVNCRHDHPGHSMWNSAHGPAKAIQLGPRDHVAVAGHRHVSGYNVVKSPDDGRICHAIRVPSYKVFDRYARDHGFRDQNFGPGCLITFDPALPDSHPDAIKPWWDPLEGAEFLAWKRKRAA